MNQNQPPRNDEANLKRLAELIFSEYGTIALAYQLVAFETEEEIEQVLRDNINETDVVRLLNDMTGRLALAGYIAGMFSALDTENLLVIIEGEIGEGEGNEGDGNGKPTTH
jgi:hypothetical protein